MFFVVLLNTGLVETVVDSVEVGAVIVADEPVCNADVISDEAPAVILAEVEVVVEAAEVVLFEAVVDSVEEEDVRVTHEQLACTDVNSGEASAVIFTEDEIVVEVEAVAALEVAADSTEGEDVSFTVEEAVVCGADVISGEAPAVIFGEEAVVDAAVTSALLDEVSGDVISEVDTM